MRKRVFPILFLIVTTGAGASVPALAAGDPALIAEVQKILDMEGQTRAKLDTHLIDTLKSIQSTAAGSMTEGLLETSLMRKETKVEDAQGMLSENHLRIEFLNEFISALAASSDPRADAPKILIDLAHKDLLSSVENQTDSKMWLFETYLSIAFRDIMEPSENFGDFLKSYMIYSSLREPKSPGGFMKGRSYLGSALESMKPKTETKDPAETPNDSDIIDSHPPVNQKDFPNNSN